MDRRRDSGDVHPSPGVRPVPTPVGRDSRSIASTVGASQRHGQASRDRRIAHQGPDPRAVPGCGVPRRIQRRTRSRPPGERLRGAREVQGRAMGPAGRERERRLQAALHHPRRQEEDDRVPQEEAPGRGRTLSRDRRGPRGRGDQLAPGRGPAAEGPREADGLPRDHEAGHRELPGTYPRHRRGAGRRAGIPAHHRPALRLRGLPGPLEEGRPAPLRRPGPERGDPHAGRPRAGADALRPVRVLGPRGDVQDGARRGVHRPARLRQRAADRGRPGLRPRHGRAEAEDRGPPERRGGGDPPRRPSERGLPCRLRGGEALHSQSGPSVHDLDPAAGGQPEAPVRRPPHDARGPATLRERLHHLHADGLGRPQQRGDPDHPRRDRYDLRSGVPARIAAVLPDQGQECAGGPRGHPPCR